MSRWSVLSNQPAPEPEPAAGGRSVWHFGPTPPRDPAMARVLAERRDIAERALRSRALPG